MWTINRILTTCFDAVFSPMEGWPGWLSLLILSGVTGVLALLAFKYTSDQAAIGRVRDEIKANLLALKLFKDELRVTLRSQRRLFWAALKLFLLSLAPFAVMIVPMVLLLIQMSLRYEWRPLRPGETTLLVAELRPDVPEKLEGAVLVNPDGVTVVKGPVRDFAGAGGIMPAATDQLPDRNAVVWQLRALEPGRHVLTLEVEGQSVRKEVMVSERPYERVSPVRPGADFWETCLYPAERPAEEGDVIQSVSVEFPKGETRIFGLDIHWVITYFIASMILALVFKPFLNVKL